MLRVKMTVEDARAAAPTVGARRRCRFSGSGPAARLRGAASGLAPALRDDRRAMGIPHAPCRGHPLEVGHRFLEHVLPDMTHQFNHTRTNRSRSRSPSGRPGVLVSLRSCAARRLRCSSWRPDFETYNARYMNHDLSHFLTPAVDADVSFAGRYPEDFLVRPRPDTIPAWHLSAARTRSKPTS